MTKASRIMSLLPAKVIAAFAASGESDSATSEGVSASLRAPPVAPQVQPRGTGAVVVDAGQRVAVPSFSGAGLRKVIEASAGLGLRVEPLGSGIARDQAPAAGTMVPLGAEVVVRFAR
jgi:cell division protein FtsI (penicillin-binding protein 3)